MPPFDGAISLYHNHQSSNLQDDPSITTTNSLTPSISATAKLQHERQKAVSFSNATKVHQIIHINDLRKIANVGDIWFTHEEYDSFRSDCIQTIKMVKQMRPLDEDSCQTLRGLEKLISPASLNKQQIRRSSRNAVLEEQEFQRAEGIVDTELMANVYSIYSIQSHADAHLAALELNQEVLL